MILADRQDQAPASRATLDDLFRRALIRRPASPALADAPNRAAFTDGGPRQLNFAEADRVVSAIAGRLRRMGLASDSIVAIQMPNTVDHVLALLGVLRAGMIPMPLPLLWRRAEAVAALSRVGAKVLFTAGRVGAVDHSRLAMNVAAEVFPIRYVCGFGADLPDGVVPFDDLYAIETLDPEPPPERGGNPAAHVALITWDVAPEGLVPVARSHAEVLAGGVSVLLEARIEQDASILTSLLPSSFAAIALSLVPWLLVGGTLVLHHPFDPAVFAAQRAHHRTGIAVVPGPLVGRLAEAGLLAAGDGLATVIALWRAPEQLAHGTAWRQPAVGLVDVQSFGEAGYFPARRGTTGKPAPIAFGMVSAPRGAAAAVPVVEIARTSAGTVALRGPMVPRHAFPPGAGRDEAPRLTLLPDGFVDTGYTCRVDAEQMMLVTGPPAGLVSVGGYRFPAQELQQLMARLGGGCRLAPLPDALSGQRLAGAAEDGGALQAALDELGVNPLVAAAFRNRRNQEAVSAA